MPKPKLKNVPAPIRQKLLNLAHDRNWDFELILTKYALERILFRISKSKFRDVFVPKGPLLFELRPVPGTRFPYLGYVGCKMSVTSATRKPPKYHNEGRVRSI